MALTKHFLCGYKEDRICHWYYFPSASMTLIKFQDTRNVFYLRTTLKCKLKKKNVEYLDGALKLQYDFNNLDYWLYKDNDMLLSIGKRTVTSSNKKRVIFGLFVN